MLNPKLSAIALVSLLTIAACGDDDTSEPDSGHKSDSGSMKPPSGDDSGTMHGESDSGSSDAG